MRIYAKGLHGVLWDLETGQEIMLPIWFDEAEGLCKCYQTNPMGRVVTDRSGAKLTWLLKGKFKWLPDRIEMIPRGNGHKCQECTSEAEWSVGDEEFLDPELQGGILFSRGRLVRRRHYCSKHYKAPQIVDAKGEVMSTWDDAGGVRPQWHS